MFGLRKGQGWAPRLLVAGWILTALAPMMIIAAIAGAISELNFLRTASKAQGTVVELVEHNGDHGSSYAPIYVFYDAAGQEQKVYSRCSSYPPAYQVGDKISVLYDPRSPREAQIERFFDTWGWMTIGGGIGLLYAVIGPVLLFFAGRMKLRATSSTSGRVTGLIANSDEPSR